MPGRKVTPEQRAQLARKALEEIRAFRVRLALLELREPPGLLAQLVHRGARAFLDRWERREQRVLSVRRG
jgi:acyl-CoA reductase-like NAD-dependent aldehyde dehydrogenase